MADRSTSRSRRSFLLTMGIGAAGAAAAAASGKSPAQDPSSGSTSAKTARPGYRVTPHIGNYYRTAKH